MGNGAVKRQEALDAQRSKYIDQENWKDWKEEENTIKILLLGGENSGKTTVFNQMSILHSKGFTQEELAKYRHHIRNNTVDSLFQLIEALRIFQLAPQTDIEEDIYQFIEFRESVSTNYEKEEWSFTKSISRIMSRIWGSKIVQKIYEKRFSYELLDSAKYFLDSLDRISLDAYVPLNEDIIHCRCRTTGINQIEFFSRSCKFLIADIGGLRTERRKWIHCFDDVLLIVFIISISDYDLRDPKEEALVGGIKTMKNSMFKEVVRNVYFRHCSVVLFMNKCDIFEAKLSVHPLRNIYPKFSGGDSLEDATKYIERIYRRKMGHSKQALYVYKTTATDTQQIKIIIECSIDHIIQRAFQDVGFE